MGLMHEQLNAQEDNEHIGTPSSQGVFSFYLAHTRILKDWLESR